MKEVEKLEKPSQEDQERCFRLWRTGKFGIDLFPSDESFLHEMTFRFRKWVCATYEIYSPNRPLHDKEPYVTRKKVKEHE